MIAYGPICVTTPTTFVTSEIMRAPASVQHQILCLLEPGKELLWLLTISQKKPPVLINHLYEYKNIANRSCV